MRCGSQQGGAPHGLVADGLETYESVACQICGTRETRALAKTGQFGLPARVSICRHDGLVFLNPRWSRARYRRFYAEEYDNYYRRTAPVAENGPDRSARLVGERILASIEVAQDPCILDIGAGRGRQLAHYGALFRASRLCAIEPSDQCADRLVTSGTVDVIARDVDSSWDADHPSEFDLITMRHVLEHLLDPINALTRISSTLKPGGLLYIAVPDMMHPNGTLRTHWFRAVHTYYFSVPTLTYLAAAAGLRATVILEDGREGEIWGLFKRETSARRPYVRPSKATYRRQMWAIRRAEARDRFLQAAVRAAGILPRPVRQTLKSLRMRGGGR